MREKFKKVVKVIYGTSNNIYIKTMLTLLCMGVFSLAFSFQVTEKVNSQANSALMYISTLSIAAFLIGVKGVDTVEAMMYEAIRVIGFLVALVMTLYFFVVAFPYMHGVKAVILTLVFTIIFAVSIYYWISKCYDIFTVLKKALRVLTEKLFNYDTENKNTPLHKLQALLENVTTFILTLAGLWVAVNTLMTPLLENLEKILKWTK